jgi:endonuclease/exonuclease/phosphatase family metal-dependent hydrolase
MAGAACIAVALAGVLAGVFDGQPATAVTTAHPAVPFAVRSSPQAVLPGDLSVMTYNVKGLPWPLASGRPEALASIAERLSALRREGRQPHVVVLQEAFTSEAKAIGRLAGYPYVVEGPYSRPAPSLAQSFWREWHLGEASPAQVDSGLVLLSDLPIRKVQRAAFPAEDCAGYDCLAAKGVLIADLALPNGSTVRVATTHLNCRKASGTSIARSDAAFGRQAAFIGAMLARLRADGVPTVLAGDFNQGQRADRISMLHGALDTVPGAERKDALSRRFDADPLGMARLAGAEWIRQKARDMQFVFDGAAARLEPMRVDVPFGTEPDGSMLSDHMGYTVHYALRNRT